MSKNISEWLSDNNIKKSTPPSSVDKTKKSSFFQKTSSKTPPHNAPNKSRPSRSSVFKSKGSDPFFHRPTAEKRDKFHPTNYIKSKNTDNIRIVPLGGLEEVGANMLFIEWEKDIIIIDTGFVFPDTRNFGIDFHIPDTSYLEKNKDRIRGVIYTHGHLDHIGGSAYILPKLGYPPIFASRLTKELILANTEEHGIHNHLKFTEITPKSRIKLGKFELEFFHINHSVPDGLAVVVNTPYGSIVHTSDFKLDYNPSDDQPIDLGRIAQIGSRGVLLALSDSTSVWRDGKATSESVIEKNLHRIIKDIPGRIVLATFASNIGRIGKIIEMAESLGRSVFICGRSMEKNIAIAHRLNYLKCKSKTLIPMRTSRGKAEKMDPSKVFILSTGSQGEEFAALTRMSNGSHRDIKLNKTDTVIFSSSPIPGNEISIVSIQNNLSHIQCRVIDDKEMDTHVSGHGWKEDSKLMTSLLNPKYLAPIHGEPYMRHDHRDMIVDELTFPRENTFVIGNAESLMANNKGISLENISEKNPFGGGKISYQERNVIDEKSIEERKHIAKHGVVFVVVSSTGSSFSIRSIGGGIATEDAFWKVLDTAFKTWLAKNITPEMNIKVLSSKIDQYLKGYFLNMRGVSPEIVVEIMTK